MCPTGILQSADDPEAGFARVAQQVQAAGYEGLDDFVLTVSVPVAVTIRQFALASFLTDEYRYVAQATALYIARCVSAAWYKGALLSSRRLYWPICNPALVPAYRNGRGGRYATESTRPGSFSLGFR